MRPLRILCFFLFLAGLPPLDAGALDIPRGAWQRSIGDLPSKCESNCPNRGVALGGFGAGSFMYNISGSFGPWADEVGEYRRTWLLGAAFHVYEKKGDEVTVKCLSTEQFLMPQSWNLMLSGDGTYYALQPKGWCVYHCFSSQISSEFFSPIIPHNYRETSYPVAIWQFELSNPTDDSVQISVMLTWPDPPFNGGSQTRTGFTTGPVQDSEVTGMVLKASHPSNPPETQNSEWCIAALNGQDRTVSYCTWERSGNGQDVLNQFADDGVLSDAVNPLDSAAAIAVKVSLAPGQTMVLPLVISWDFPVVEFKSGYLSGQSTQWFKRYCEYFDTLSDNSFAIAKEALQNYGNWEAQIDSWMSVFVDDPRYPDWLICAGFNELYYNQFGGSFWESGLRSGHSQEYMGLHPEDHKNFIMESQLYPLCGNINVGHYSSIVYAKFWPEMEKDLLRCHADVVIHYPLCAPSLPNQTSPEIGAPRDCSPGYCRIGDPFFVWDPHAYRSRPAPCAEGDVHALTDNSSKFVQRCWRYFALYGDMEFLNYVWPAVESTYHFMQAYDCETEPKDSLPHAQGYDNTYDGWGMHGTDMYSGGFWVGALEAMDTMAALLNKPVRAQVQAWLEAARRNLDAQLWDSAGSYYRIDTQSSYPQAVFADALCGQRYCESLGLTDILPRWRMTMHLNKVYDVCVAPNADLGARLGRLPDGSIVPTGDRDTYEYWVGTTYYLAAMMYHAGLKDKALNTAFGAYHPVYEVDSLAYWFNTPEAWWDGGIRPRPKDSSSWERDHALSRAQLVSGFREDPTLGFPNQYQRPRAVWELIFEMKKDSVDFLCGDANGDGMIDIGDIVAVLNYLYRSGVAPCPLAAADANCDQIVDLGDAVYLINYLFKHGLPPCAR